MQIFSWFDFKKERGRTRGKRFAFCETVVTRRCLSARWQPCLGVELWTFINPFLLSKACIFRDGVPASYGKRV